jgi:hypothetical protein
LMPATVSGGGACSVPRISGISCTMLRAGMGPWCSIVVCMLDTYRAAVGILYASVYGALRAQPHTLPLQTWRQCSHHSFCSTAQRSPQ